MSNEGFSIRPSQKKLEQPRRVRHGIKFRRKLGLEGLPWHAARFVEAVEADIRPDAKVMGMEYALAGQVANYTVSPGVVEAAVQGRGVRPYQVRITVILHELLNAFHFQLQLEQLIQYTCLHYLQALPSQRLLLTHMYRLRLLS